MGTTTNTGLSGLGLFFGFGGAYLGWQAAKHLRGHSDDSLSFPPTNGPSHIALGP